MSSRMVKIAFLGDSVELFQVVQKRQETPYEWVFSTLESPSLAVDTVLGIETGELFADIVILCVDDLPPLLQYSCVEDLVGAGIPTFLYSKLLSVEDAWKMAAIGAKLLRLDFMEQDFAHALSSRKFDPATLELENEFAAEYDEKELSSLATLSAILWENEYVLEHIRNYAAAANRPLRILDLGCGTGRFEEILMKDPYIAEHIASIDAVDFAPMYLKQAKSRLSHFLSPDKMEKIHFKRRIAEETLLPSNHYDVSIASFGIICFSQFHRTLPEIQRMLKPEGLACFNGYNRNAIAYDMKVGSSSFVANIDKEWNEMDLLGKKMKCFTFDIQELHSFLCFIGFKPVVKETKTFPTLYSFTKSDHLALHRSESLPFGKLSYCSQFLEKFFLKEGMTSTLQSIDKELTKALHDRGFYFSMVATK